MNEQSWQRKEYETWDEAFRALAPAVRQQSVRVAEYTQVLFVGACSSDFAQDSAEGRERIRGKNTDLAYKCGLYHQIGKALVPPEYQIWQNDFTEEEKAVYRKYTTDGRLLAAMLQDRAIRAKEKRTGILLEQPTRNIQWLMVREACEQHMERYDGVGYPNGLAGDTISPIAQIVGLAKELDRLSSETKLEKPFDAAIAELTAQAGTNWSPILIEVLKKNVDRCRDIYNKYIFYTRTLPETIPLVVKHEDRPMGLTYRPMVSDGDGTISGYEAIPRFGGIAGRPGETEGAPDIEELLSRSNLIAEISRYFMYEACDTLLRLKNCKIETKGILLQMLPSYYKLPSQLQMLNQLFEDQPVPRTQLFLTIPESVVRSAKKTQTEILARYLRYGINLVVDDYRPDRLPMERLQEIGFQYVRFAPELYMQQSTANTMYRMKEEGFHILGGCAEERDTLLWLLASGAELVSGPVTGPISREDDIVLTALAKENAAG